MRRSLKQCIHSSKARPPWSLSARRKLFKSVNKDATQALPSWSWVGPLLAAAWLGIAFIPSLSVMPFVWNGLAAIALGVSVFASVYHAEIIALRVGEPLGSLVLAVATEAKSGDHILVMSNGGFGGVHQKILKAIAS